MQSETFSEAADICIRFPSEALPRDVFIGRESVNKILRFSIEAALFAVYLYISRALAVPKNVHALFILGRFSLSLKIFPSNELFIFLVFALIIPMYYLIYK